MVSIRAIQVSHTGRVFTYTGSDDACLLLLYPCANLSPFGPQYMALGLIAIIATTMPAFIP
jgi:hypothetical protein